MTVVFFVCFALPLLKEQMLLQRQVLQFSGRQSGLFGLILLNDSPILLYWQPLIVLFICPWQTMTYAGQSQFSAICFLCASNHRCKLFNWSIDAAPQAANLHPMFVLTLVSQCSRFPLSSASVFQIVVRLPSRGSVRPDAAHHKREACFCYQYYSNFTLLCARLHFLKTSKFKWRELPMLR